MANYRAIFMSAWCRGGFPGILFGFLFVFRCSVDDKMIDDGRRAATFYFIPRNSARKLLEHLASLKEEEDPKKEIFPKTAFFGSFTIMRIEWRRKEGRRTHARVRRQSRMQIGDSRRPRSSRRTEEDKRTFLHFRFLDQSSHFSNLT